MEMPMPEHIVEVPPSLANPITDPAHNVYKVMRMYIKYARNEKGFVMRPKDWLTGLPVRETSASM